MSLEAGSVRARCCSHTVHLGWVPSPDRTELTCNATKRLPLTTSLLLALKTMKRKHRIISPELQRNFSPSFNKIKPTMVPTCQPEVELPPLFPRLPGLSPSEEQPTPGPGPEGRPPPSLRRRSPPPAEKGRRERATPGPHASSATPVQAVSPTGDPPPAQRLGWRPALDQAQAGPAATQPPTASRSHS